MQCKITGKGLDVPIMNTAIKIIELNEETSEAANEVESIACECCGMSEECTPTYIKRVKEFFVGKWICGLCSEAVKEQMKPSSIPRTVVTKEEALHSHMSLCSNFNRTIRPNPKLSLAVSMRDIARKNSERRTIKASPGSKIAKAVSCGPMLDAVVKQSDSVI